MDKKQTAALKYMICMAKNEPELSKRVLLFLIDRSRGLTKEVCLSIAEGEFTADEISEAGIGVGNMQSVSGTTHINQLLAVGGTKLSFSVHYGHIDPFKKGTGRLNTTGQMSEIAKPMRYTWWLADKYYSSRARLVRTDRSVLDVISLDKDGYFKQFFRNRLG